MTNSVKYSVHFLLAIYIYMSHSRLYCQQGDRELLHHSRKPFTLPIITAMPHGFVAMEHITQFIAWLHVQPHLAPSLVNKVIKNIKENPCTCHNTGKKLCTVYTHICTLSFGHKYTYRYADCILWLMKASRVSSTASGSSRMSMASLLFRSIFTSLSRVNLKDPPVSK